MVAYNRAVDEAVQIRYNSRKSIADPSFLDIEERVKIFSLSVSAATLPNPTEVMQVIVKYNAVTYMVLLDGPATNSGAVLVLVHR